MIMNAKGRNKTHAIFRDARYPWAIDMDGTLIEEDVTVIAFRKSMILPWFWPWLLWACLVHVSIGDQAALRFLEHRIPLSPQKEVTYNPEVLSLLESHRKRGGGAVLATASHVSAGHNVVERGKLSGLFDDVLGSCMMGDGKRNYIMNMAAEEKANVLNKLLTPMAKVGKRNKGFLYAGNSRDDLAVWSHPSCRGMILVNCDDSVLEEALQIPKPNLIIPRKHPRKSWSTRITSFLLH